MFLDYTTKGKETRVLYLGHVHMVLYSWTCLLWPSFTPTRITMLLIHPWFHTKKLWSYLYPVVVWGKKIMYDMCDMIFASDVISGYGFL